MGAPPVAESHPLQGQIWGLGEDGELFRALKDAFHALPLSIQQQSVCPQCARYLSTVDTIAIDDGPP